MDKAQYKNCGISIHSQPPGHGRGHHDSGGWWWVVVYDCKIYPAPSGSRMDTPESALECAKAWIDENFKSGFFKEKE